MKTMKTRDELFDKPQSFVTDLDGISRRLNEHELDIDGFSFEVNNLIGEFLDANFQE